MLSIVIASQPTRRGRPTVSEAAQPNVVPDIVQLAEKKNEGPDWTTAANGIEYLWEGGHNGNYLDSEDVLNGSTHYASQPQPHPFSGVEAEFDVAAIIPKLLEENTGFALTTDATTPAFYHDRTTVTPPVLSIVTSVDTFTPTCTQDCWINDSGSGTFPDSEGTTRQKFPSFIKFDLSEVTGTLVSATLTITGHSSFQSGKTIFVDYLKMPALVHDPVRQLGGVVQGIAADGANDLDLASHGSVIFYPSFASLGDITAAWTTQTDNNPGREIISWPQYGLPAVRLTSAYPGNTWGGQSTIISWRKTFTAGTTELYARYLLKIDEDAFVALNEPGVKLPGFEGGEGTDSNLFSYRMHHADGLNATDRASGLIVHPNVYRFTLHAYDATHKVSQFPSSAEGRKTSVCLVAGRTYCIEQRVKLNTKTGETFNSDGIIQIWVDGVPVYSDTSRQILDADPLEITNFFANIYHGGQATPLAPYHYEFGAVCVATEYIGPPVNFDSALPTWREGMAVNEWKEIPGTNPSTLDRAAYHEEGIQGVSGPADMIRSWCGMSVDTRVSTLYSLAGGGHNGYYGNQAIKLNLSVDAPVWEEAAPTTAAAQTIWEARVYADGRPASRHSYYGNQFIEARNLAMCFGSVAVPTGGGTRFPNIVSFDPATGLYGADDGTFPDCPNPGGIRAEQALCKDPATENVYGFFGNRLDIWTQATNTWSSASFAANINAGWHPAIVDTRRNRMVILNVYFGSSVWAPLTITLDTLTLTQQAYTGDTAAAEAIPYGSGITFFQHESDAAQDCFLVMKKEVAAGAIVRINASTFFVDALPVTGGANVPASESAGIHNRFISVPALGGIAYVSKWQENVWFLRTH